MFTLLQVGAVEYAPLSDLIFQSISVSEVTSMLTLNLDTTIVSFGLYRFIVASVYDFVHIGFLASEVQASGFFFFLCMCFCLCIHVIFDLVCVKPFFYLQKKTYLVPTSWLGIKKILLVIRFFFFWQVCIYVDHQRKKMISTHQTSSF